MKKFIFAILAVVVAAMVGGSIASATVYVNQADINAIEWADKSYNNLIKAANDESTSTSILEVRVKAAATAFGTVKDHKFSTKLGSEYTSKAEDVKKKAGEMQSELQKLPEALNSGDDATIEAAFGAVEAKVKEYDESVKALNGAVNTSNKKSEEKNAKTGGLYKGLTVLTVLITIGSFVWAFVLGKDVKRPELKAARRSVALNSLAPLAGAGITWGTFALASNNGGRYTIMYGLVIVGFIAFGKAIFEYIKLTKGAQPPTQTPPSAQA